MTELTYSYLRPDEWTELIPFLGDKLPHPSTARIVVARRDDKIVSYFVVQMTFHAEPLWIAEEERGRVNWLKMLHMHESSFLKFCHGGYYIFSPNKKISGMCEAAGLEAKPWTVFWKDVP